MKIETCLKLNIKFNLIETEKPTEVECKSFFSDDLDSASDKSEFDCKEKAS